MQEHYHTIITANISLSYSRSCKCCQIWAALFMVGTSLSFSVKTIITTRDVSDAVGKLTVYPRAPSEANISRYIQLNEGIFLLVSLALPEALPETSPSRDQCLS